LLNTDTVHVRVTALPDTVPEGLFPAGITRPRVDEEPTAFACHAACAVVGTNTIKTATMIAGPARRLISERSSW
jgi:hypothetical protein